MNLAEFKSRLDKQSKITKWALGLGAIAVGGIVGSFVILSITKLVIIAALVAAVTYGGPVMIERMKLAKLDAFKAMARKSPVETLEVEYIKDQQALQQRLDKITKFGAKVKNFGDELDTFCRDWPADSSKFKDQFAKMDQLYKLRQQKWQQAKKDLLNREKEIKRAGAIWKMACASAELSEAAGSVEDEFFSRLKQETAFETIRTGFNQSMADLDVLLMEEVDLSAPAITHQPPDVIDMGAAVEIPDAVPVTRNSRGA